MEMLQVQVEQRVLQRLELLEQESVEVVEGLPKVSLPKRQ